MSINVSKLHILHQKLWTDIKFLIYRSAFYYNKHYAEAFMLKKRDKVYLLWKNIETIRSSSKINYVRIKSFKIIKNIKEVSFKLKLLKDMQWKHSIFYMLLLKLASDDVSVLEQVLNNYLIK